MYTTLGCHLCDEAEALLVENGFIDVLAAMGVSFVKHDVADDVSLFKVYGERIPVLQMGDALPLYWPFTAAELATYLNESFNTEKGVR